MDDIADELGSTVIDSIYEVWGRAATYVPPGGGPAVPCVIRRDVNDVNAKPDDGTPLVGQKTIDVRSSEIAAPAPNGVFTLIATGQVFTVSNRPVHPQDDLDGRVWRMWVT